MRMRWMPAALLALAACGTGGGSLSANGEQLYQVTATVLESPKHPVELCVGAVMESLPPQCEGLPLAGWDWAKVDDEESVNGTTWGAYSVVGTFDGETFTITEPAKPPQYEDVKHDFTPPCPKPSGGWEHPDPGKMSHEYEQAAIEAAQREPDFAGVWLYGEPPEGAEPAGFQDPATKVLNVAFTGDLERHETELRKHWGGGLCLVLHEHTLARLRQIQEEAALFLRDRDRQMITASSSERNNVVELTVVFATPEDQTALDARYGKDVVALTALLKPVA